MSRLREVNRVHEADRTPIESDRIRRVTFRENLVSVAPEDDDDDEDDEEDEEEEEEEEEEGWKWPSDGEEEEDEKEEEENKKAQEERRIAAKVRITTARPDVHGYPSRVRVRVGRGHI